MRKCLETSVQFYAAMREISETDRLHQVILDEIGRLSPETAEAICLRIDQLAAEWRG